ncbi:MAG: TM1802 family CRISPR-associated protein, partial [Halobacteriaceae archaeon]
AYLIEEEDRGSLNEHLTLDKLRNEETLLAIQFEKVNDHFEYADVAIFDLAGNEEHVLYWKDWHNTFDETPTSKIHRVDTLSEKQNRETAVRNDAVDWIFEGWYAESESSNSLVTDVNDIYSDQEKKIRQDLNQKLDEVEDRDSCVLTVQYEGKDGEMHFIADLDFFNEVVLSKVAENWAEKHTEVSRAESETCTLCHNDETVYGFAFPLPIYTVDNRKHAPDFDQKRSWENIPLCEDCAFELRVARNFIENNNFNFYIGEPIDYYVVPNFPLEGPKNDILMENILNGSASDEYSFLDAEAYYDTADLD